MCNADSFAISNPSNGYCIYEYIDLNEYSLLFALNLAVTIGTNLLVALRAIDLLLTPTSSHDHMLVHY